MARSRQLWLLAFALMALPIAPSSALAGWKAIKPLQVSNEDQDSLFLDNRYYLITGASSASSSGKYTKGDAEIDVVYGYIPPEPYPPPFTESQGLYYPIIGLGTYSAGSQADGAYFREWIHISTDNLKGEVEYLGQSRCHFKATTTGFGGYSIETSSTIRAMADDLIAESNAQIDASMSHTGNTFSSSPANAEQEETDDAAIIKCPTKRFSIWQQGTVSVAAKAQIKASETAKSGGAAKVLEDGSNKDIYFVLLEHWVCP